MFFPVATWRGYSNIMHNMCSSQSLLGRDIPTSDITCVLPCRYLEGLFQHQTLHVFFPVATWQGYSIIIHNMCSFQSLLGWAIPTSDITCVLPSRYLLGYSNVIHSMCFSQLLLGRAIPTSYITCVPPRLHLSGMFQHHT